MDIEKIKQKALFYEDLDKGSKIKRIFKEPIRLFPLVVYWIIGNVFRPITVKHKLFWGVKLKTTIPGNTILFLKGFYEVNLFNFILNYIKEGFITVDIGTNEGSYTKLLSKLVNDSGKVFGFEPTYRTFKILKGNTMFDKNVVVNNLALLDEEKEIYFEDYGPRFSALNTFKKREVKGLPTPTKIKVQATTLDIYFKKFKIDRCEFIKIDAEGAESLILGGMNYILENIKPVISIEVGGGEEWSKNNEDSISILTNKGYLIFEIDKNGFLYKRVKETYVYDNLIAVHKDMTHSVSKLIK